MMMRPLAALFGLWAALAGAPTQAVEVGLVANSIVRTYTDYCDPLFFGRYLPPDARWDPTLSENYARILRTRYLSNCEAFMTEEVLAAITVPRILSMFPRLSEDQSGQLTAEQLMLIGVGAYLDEVDATSCPNAPQGLELATSLRSATGSWFASAGYDDALDIARGYAQAKSYAASWPGMPTAGNPCLEREGAYMFAAAYAVKAGLIPLQPSPGALPEADWQKNYDWDGDGVVGDDDTAADNSPQIPPAEYAWEPGDPSANRGDGRTIDQSQHVSATDAATIAKLAGRWGTTPACDVPGEQYLIGQFELGEPNTLGVGVPRIQAADLSCEVGQFRSFGEAHTFNAMCLGEGDTWTGTGSVQPLEDGKIALYLFDQPDPIQLARCEPERQAPLDVGVSN